MSRPLIRSRGARLVWPACVLLAALALACHGEPGPDGDRYRSPEQVQAEAQRCDRARLELVVEEYKQHIQAREGELHAREADIREKAGGVIDAVLGTGPNDGVRAEVGKLKASVMRMGAELRALNEKLALYSRELARRE